MLRISLAIFLTLVLFFGMTANCDAQSGYNLDFTDLDISAARRRSGKKLHSLAFDSEHSNVSVIQADNIVGGLFNTNTGNTYGTWSVNLGYEDQQPQWRFSVQIEIKDISGRQVKKTTKSKTIPRSKFESYKLSQVLPNLSKIYSGLIKEAREDLERDVIASNKLLEAVKNAPLSQDAAIEYLVTSLSMTLDNTRTIAIRIDGPDPNESKKIRSDLTKGFLNSSKSYTIENHQDNDIIEDVRKKQTTPFYDLNSIAEMGKELGALVIVYGSWELTTNKKKYLMVQALDVETRQIYGLSSVTF